MEEKTLSSWCGRENLFFFFFLWATKLQVYRCAAKSVDACVQLLADVLAQVCAQIGLAVVVCPLLLCVRLLEPVGKNKESVIYRTKVLMGAKFLVA